MEVSLVEASGIPEGCLISVRAGATRRQAAVEAGKPCKLSFPKGVSYANPFKVDLLAPLGDTTVEVSSGTEKYPFEVKSRYGGKSMNLTLRVREDSNNRFCPDELDGLYSVRQSIGDNLAASIASESPARRHQAAIEQRAYLDTHEMLPWVHGLLQDLIRDRPGDPWSYIDASTAKARKTATAMETDVPKAQEEAQTDLAVEAPKAARRPSASLDTLKQNAKASLLKASEAQDKSKPAPDEEVQEEPQEASAEALRLKTKATLMNSAKSGELEAKLRDGQSSKVEATPDVDGLRLQAKAILMNGAASGELAAKVRDCKKPGNVEVEKKSPTAEELRLKAKATLVNSAYSGALEAKLTDKFPSKSEKASTDDELRLKAKDGQSSKVEQAPTVEALRLQAKAILLNGAASGELAAEVRAACRQSSKVEKEATEEELRLKAKASLMNGVSSGQLKAKLSDAQSAMAQKSPTDEQLRLKAKATLMTGVYSGELEAKLRDGRPSKVEETPNVGDLRLQAKAILMKGAASGELAAKVKATHASKEQDEMRQRTMEALQEADSNGRIADVFNEQASTSVPDDLRKKTQEALQAAAANGQLAAAMMAVQNGRAPQPSSGLAQGPLDARVNPGDALNSPMSTAPNTGMNTSATSNLGGRKEARALEKIQENLQSKAADGYLQNALQELAADDTREEARQVLLNATQSGQLSGEVAENNFGVVCQRKWETLAQAEKDGNLMNALEDAGDPAVQRRRMAERLFEKMDLKNDGVIDRDEMDKAIENGIIKRPAGFVTAKEAAVAHQRRAAESNAAEAKPAMKASSSAPALAPSQKLAGAAKSSPIVVELDARGRLVNPSGSTPSPSRSQSTSAMRKASPDVPVYVLPVGAKASPDETRRRQEMFMQDNEALRRENARLKKLREAGDLGNKLKSQNDSLRSELTKMMSIHRKESGLMRSNSLARSGY